MAGVKVLSPDPAAAKPGELTAGLLACAAVDPPEFVTAAEKQQFPAVGPDWYTVAVTLTRAELAVAINGRPFYRKARNQLLKVAAQFGLKAPHNAAVTPTFDPAEGVGVFATHGRAEIRAARLDLAPAG
jgi:hypothetical protein